MRNINFKGVLIFAILMVSGVIPSSFAAIEVLEIFHASSQNCDGSFLIEASGDAGAFTVIVSDDTGSIVSTFSDVNGEIEVSNLCSGLYTIEVRNAYECVTTLSATIVACPDIKLEDLEDAIEHPTACNASDGSIYFRFGGPTGGTAPYTMTLYDSDGNIIPRLSFQLSWTYLSAGLYTFHVEDANGCSAEFEFELIPQLGAIITDHFIEAPCPGEVNGAIEIFIIGATEYTINWSNGETGAEIENLTAGTYCVTVSDGVCNSEECYTISELDLKPLNITNAYIRDACTGASNGAINIFSIEGGKPPYSYLWSNGQGTDQDLTDIPMGEYCLTITDACNATFVECFAVREEPLLSVSGIVVSDACPTINEYDMFSVPKGGIDIEIAGGNSGYQIQWSHDENYSGRAPRGLDPGTYCVTVTSSGGNCGTATECFVVEQRDGLVVTVADYQQCESGDCSGAFIDINVNGNTGPVTFDWFGYVDGGSYFESSDEDINNVPGIGRYCVTVTSDNECPAELCLDIEDCEDIPDPKIIQHFVAPQSEIFEFGAIDLNVYPQDVTFAYSWTGPNGFTASTQDLFPADGAGEYTVTINDGCGVEITETYIIEECGLDLSVESLDNRCSGEGYAQVIINVANTTAEDEFLFFNPATESFQPTSSKFFPDGNFTRLAFSTNDGLINIGVINQDGCGGIISVTVDPSSIHANSWDYSYFVPDFIAGGYSPVYCGIATTCAGELVDDEFIDVYEISQPSLEHDPNTQATCIMNLSCGSHFNFTLGGNIIADIVTLAPDGFSCLQGEFCQGSIALSNNATGFRDYSRLNTGIDNPAHQQITVTVNAPFQAVNIGTVQTETSLDGKDCIRQKKCPDGTIVEHTDIGDPVTIRQCRTNPTTGADECWDVEFCGDQIVNETYLGNLPPFGCGCIMVLADDSNSESELPQGIINDRIIDPSNKTEIRPLDVTIKTSSSRLKQDIEESLQSSESGNIALVYPNPTTNLLNIRFDDEKTLGTFRIILTDILGQEVSSINTSESIVMSLHDLEAGVYILTIFDKNGQSQSQQIFKH